MAAAASLRAALPLGLWAALAGMALADLPVGIGAAALGAWASLRLLAIWGLVLPASLATGRMLARRGVGVGFATHPVPQAIILTGIFVAFAATTIAVALLLRRAARTDGA